MRYLTTAEYDAIVRLGLAGLGLDRQTADRLIGLRWPMHGPGLVAEAAGRGLAIDLATIQAWLDEHVGPTWSDGQPVEARTTLFSESLAREVFAWAVAHGRAEPTPTGHALAERPDVLDQLLRAAAAEGN